jgi:phage terminase small subunit
MRDARSNATRLMENDGIQARIAEIMAVGAERAEVTAEARIAEIMAVGAERAEVTAEEVIRELKKLVST